MHFKADTPSVTIALMMAFALFVLYTRFKNWLDSNVPIFFYVLLIVLVNSLETNVPHILVYAACALGLLLRFEFMNVTAAKIFKFLEACLLLWILWDCFTTVTY